MQSRNRSRDRDRDRSRSREWKTKGDERGVAPKWTWSASRWRRGRNENYDDEASHHITLHRVGTRKDGSGKSRLRERAGTQNESKVVLRHWRDTSGTDEVLRGVGVARDEFR